MVAASSGSGSDDTGNSTNNNDGYSSNSSSSSSSNSYDGNNTNLSTPGEDFTDADGNTYSTTIIDDLVWTTSNANHSTYRDGTPIPHITDYEEWGQATTGAWTYFAQDATLGYGKIYNFHAIMGKYDDDPSTPNKAFAPQGWRVPSYTNWNSILVKFRIPPSTNYSASARAHKSTTSWTNINGTNHSGLNVKPNGYITALESSFNSGTNSQGNYVQTATVYWSTRTIQNYYGITAQFSGISDLAVLSGSEYYTPFNGAYNQSGNTINHGNYVRLVKDAN